MILGTEINNSAAWQPPPGLRSAKTNEVLTMALVRQACREEKKKRRRGTAGIDFLFRSAVPDRPKSGRLSVW